MNNGDGFNQAVNGNSIRNGFQGQMRGGKRNAQHGIGKLAVLLDVSCQHHDDTFCSGFFRKIFSMSCKRNVCVIDDAFLNRCRGYGIKGAVQGTVNGNVHE